MANYQDMTSEEWIADLEAVLFSTFGLRPGGVAGTTEGVAYGGFVVRASVEPAASDRVVVTAQPMRDAHAAPSGHVVGTFAGRLEDDPQIVGSEVAAFIKANVGPA